MVRSRPALVASLILGLGLGLQQADQVAAGAPAAAVADSVRDFSGTQGQGGWYYGYFDCGNTTNCQVSSLPSFTQMTQFSSGVWYEQNGTYWTELWTDGGHPNSTSTSGGRTAEDQWTVRRWISTTSGAVLLSGQVTKNQLCGGDGIIAHILVDGTEVWSQTVSGNDTTGVTYRVPATVHVGSTVDFAIDPNASDICDSTLFTATIQAITHSGDDFGANLIVNGDAEAGAGSSDGNAVVSVPAWTTVSPFTVVPYNTAGGFPLSTDPGPTNRGLNFFAGGCCPSTSSASQTIPLQPGDNGSIDSGNATYDLTGYLGGFSSQDDNAQVTITFYNADNVALGDPVTIGPVYAADRNSATGLLFREATGSVPKHTRSIGVTLLMTRTAGSYDDGYADNLGLVLDGGATQPPTTSASATVGTGDTTYDLTSSPWTSQPVTVTLTPTDHSFTGISGTFYAVDCASPPDCTYQTYSTPVVISAPSDHSNDGAHTITFYSADNDDHSETAQTVTIKIDSTGPGVSFTTPPDGITYDAVSQYSLASNPNGAWSYRVNGSLLLGRSSSCFGTSALCWTNGQPFPNNATIPANQSSQTVSYSGTIQLPPDYLSLDAESNPHLEVRWTAPSTGTYTVTGNFLGIDTGEASHPVAILQNGDTSHPLYSNTISSYGQKDSFSLSSVMLNAGDTIGFLNEPNGASNLSTGLQATIVHTDVTNTGIYTVGQNVAAAYSCSDGASGVASCTDSRGGSSASPGTLDTSSVGTRALFVTATDNAGNSTTRSVVYTVKASQPPTTAAGAQNADHTTYDLMTSPGTKQAVTITLTPTDHSDTGIAATYYAVDCPSPPDCTYQTYSTPVVISAPSNHSNDGTHTVTFYSTDDAGNSETAHSVTVKIDTTPPATTDNADSSWHNSDVTVTLTPSDTGGSGVAATYYKVDGASSYSTGTSVLIQAKSDHSNDGTHTITYYSTDTAGNSESTHTAHVKIDTTAPVTTDDAPTGWKNTAVTVTLTPSDTGGSGVATTYYKVDSATSYTQGTSVSISAPSDHSNDGTHSITYYSVDAVGNAESAHSTSVRIDTTPPTTTDNADSSWHNSQVTVTLTPSDAGGSGVAATYYKVDGATSYSTGTSVVVAAPTNHSNDGTHIITYYSTDTAGNTEGTHTASVKIDTRLPVTTDNAPSGWQNTPVTVTLSPSTTGGAQIAATYYKIDSASSYTQGTSVLISAPSNHSNDGVHTITYYSTDTAENSETPHSATVRIDTTPPVTTDNAPSGWRNSQVTVILTPSDTGGSGVTATYYKVDGASSYTQGTSVVIAAPSNHSNDGTHTITYYSTDNAGNTETAHSTSVRIDTTSPVTTDNAPSSWHNSAVTVTLTPSDTGGSGVAATYYKIDSASSYTQGTSVLISAPADHSNDGIHTITYSSTDNAGNTETAHSTTVKIDTTGPAISVSGVTNGRGALAPAVPTITFSDPPPSTLSSSTSTSGYKSNTMTLDGSPYTAGTAISALGPHTLAIQATDAAGNVSTQTIAFTVFAYPSTGRFVLGDGTVSSALAAATPQSVTFYSPNWYQLNPLVNPPQAKYAPTTFKGMAASTSSSPPACGGTWTGTGSYTTAAPASVPTYMGVLVSSSITLAGSKLTGNITRIVVVKTSAYSANQGRTGTGIIVATSCGP